LTLSVWLLVLPVLLLRSRSILIAGFKNVDIVHWMDTHSFRNWDGCGRSRRPFFPRTTLRLAFAAEISDGTTMFFVRHWGALLFVVCTLTVYAGYVPASRLPILTAAVIEKIVIVALIFFGPIKRTVAMTIVGTIDGILAILFVAYLAG